MEDRLRELYINCATPTRKGSRRGGGFRRRRSSRRKSAKGAEGEAAAIPDQVAITDIVRYVQEQGLVQPDGADHFQSVLETADDNKDGSITLAEFQHAIELALSSSAANDTEEEQQRQQQRQSRRPRVLSPLVGLTKRTTGAKQPRAPPQRTTGTTRLPEVRWWRP